MTEATAVKEKCKGCGREIEVCSCCEEPHCPAAICFGCLSQELTQTYRQPHAHGG
jgi:hypothetical protein